MITPAQIDEYRKVAAAATPGPWTPRDFARQGETHTQKIPAIQWTPLGSFKPCNATHIATFNPETVGQLLDEIIALREALREAENNHSTARSLVRQLTKADYASLADAWDRNIDMGPQAETLIREVRQFLGDTDNG